MIKKVIENKLQAEKQAESGVTVYPCEEILGAMKPVKEFAAFYVTHRQDIEVVKYHFLLQYCEVGKFTPEQLESFRMGLDCFIKFFENSESDTKSYVMQATKKK